MFLLVKKICVFSLQKRTMTLVVTEYVYNEWDKSYGNNQNLNLMTCRFPFKFYWCCFIVYRHTDNRLHSYWKPKVVSSRFSYYRKMYFLLPEWISPSFVNNNQAVNLWKFKRWSYVRSRDFCRWKLLFTDTDKVNSILFHL